MEEKIGVRQAVVNLLQQIGPMTISEMMVLMPPHITLPKSVSAAASNLKSIGAVKTTGVRGREFVWELADASLVPEQKKPFRAIAPHHKEQPERVCTRGRPEDTWLAITPRHDDQSEPNANVTGPAPTAPQATDVEYYAIARFPDGSKIKLTLEQAILLRG